MTPAPELLGLDGVPVPADHGDPDAEYRAAQDDAAVFDRSFRPLLHVSGRAPARMFSGLVTGAIPPDPKPAGERTFRGRMPYSLILTPKGRIVTDLRIGRLEAGEEGSLLLDFPPAGVDPARAHMGRYLPPRFARIDEPEEPLGFLTVVGPEAPNALEEIVFDGDGMDLANLLEGDEAVRDDGSAVGIRVIRCGDVAPPGFDVVGGRETLRSIRARLEERSVRPAGTVIWDVLRIEKGRPAFGVEIDERVLPPEAGLGSRAFDHAKGCYTGQEVIVRIRDRGHVNRHLRGLLLGNASPPEPGTPLFHPGRTASSGEIRSSARSPSFEETIALAYLRREVEPLDTVHVGAPDGPAARVRAVDEDGWKEPQADERT